MRSEGVQPCLYARVSLDDEEKGREKIERFPGLFRRQGDAPRAHACVNSITSSPRLCMDSAIPTITGRARARSRCPTHRGAGTLLLNARDDPFMPEAALPRRDEVSPSVRLEFPDQGGHAAFVTVRFRNLDWMPRRVDGFLRGAIAGRETGSPACANGTMPDPGVLPMKYPRRKSQAYDIRGVVGSLLRRRRATDRTGARQRALERSSEGDGRRSQWAVTDGSPGLSSAQALAEGIRASGVDVAGDGMFATPIAYFAGTRTGLRQRGRGHGQPHRPSTTD